MRPRTRLGCCLSSHLDCRVGRPAAPKPLASSFELHIEQGPILEAEKLEIGIVEAVPGFRWYTLELFGDQVHAGSTPMGARKDPARALAEYASVSAVQVFSCEANGKAPDLWVDWRAAPTCCCGLVSRAGRCQLACDESLVPSQNCF